MSKNTWNKKALAGVAAFAVIGALSPIAAIAEDMGPSSVTYTVDLNEGGGGGVVCPTQTTFTVDPGASQPTSLGVTDAVSSDPYNQSQSFWYDNDTNSQSTNSGGNVTQDNFNEWVRNKKRSYSFTPMTVRFDADGCEVSTIYGEVFAARGPVLRAATSSGDYSVAEIRNDEAAGLDGFGTADNVGMANLYANSSNMMGVNYTAPYWNAPLWRTNVSLDSNSSGGDQWPLAGGSDGEFNLQPRIDIFGDTPTGVYKVTYHLWLDVYDPGITGNNCWWYCW